MPQDFRLPLPPSAKLTGVSIVLNEPATPEEIAALIRACHEQGIATCHFTKQYLGQAPLEYDAPVAALAALLDNPESGVVPIADHFAEAL